MADSEVVNALRMRVQVEWEKAMDRFYEGLDRLSAGSAEIEDSDVVRAVARQIDEETAEAYQKWIEG